MRKKYIIRFHLTAHEDYMVEANSPEDAYKMYKSGEYANYHEDIGVLYGSENKFHGIWEVGEDGKWIGENGTDDPLIKCEDYVHPFDWRKKL